MRWIVGSHTNGCWLGSYENEKQKLFALAVEPGSVVFDIGANAGFYTLLASVLVGPRGHVYAFEPLPHNIHFIREHLRLNEITNVEIIEAAVSDKTGETSFDDSLGGAMGHLAPGGNLRIQTVRIDELVAESRLPPPDHIKIDVEGDEMLVLSGAKKVLEDFRPKLFLSTHAPEVHRECCALLNKLGYKLQALGGKDITDADELFAH